MSVPASPPCPHAGWGAEGSGAAHYDFSVDRVGMGGFDKRVARYLTPRAKAAANKFKQPRTFDGWLTVPCRLVTTRHADSVWTLVASPDGGPPNGDGTPADWSDDKLDQNRYHAHVPIPAEMHKLFFGFLARDSSGRASYTLQRKHWNQRSLSRRTDWPPQLPTAMLALQSHRLSIRTNQEIAFTPQLCVQTSSASSSSDASGSSSK
jgi:hypothetical protein